VNILMLLAGQYGYYRPVWSNNSRPAANPRWWSGVRQTVRTSGEVGYFEHGTSGATDGRERVRQL